MILRIPAREGEDCGYRPGIQYSVRLRGLEGRERITVEAAHRQRLGSVTQRDVLQEVAPFKTRTEWRCDWVKRHDARWVEANTCYAGSTLLDGEPSLPPSDVELCSRFGAFWAALDCWVIQFSLIEPEQFLARQDGTMPGNGSTGQYTPAASRAIDMLPVIPPDPAYVAYARLRGIEMRESLRADLEAERALRRAQGARAAKKSARGELRAQSDAG